MNSSELKEHNKLVIDKYLEDKRIHTRIKVRPIIHQLAEEIDYELSNDFGKSMNMALLFGKAWRMMEAEEAERRKLEKKSDLKNVDDLYEDDDSDLYEDKGSQNEYF